MVQGRVSKDKLGKRPFYKAGVQDLNGDAILGLVGKILLVYSGPN